MIIDTNFVLGPKDLNDIKILWSQAMLVIVIIGWLFIFLLSIFPVIAKSFYHSKMTKRDVLIYHSTTNVLCFAMIIFTALYVYVNYFS